MVKADDQWLYLPALKRVKRSSSSNRSGSFMGSEFSYGNMGAQEVEKQTCRYLAGCDITLANIDVTHRFVMEVQRLHPVISLHLRTSMNAFDVEGYRVPAYSTVRVAFPATHDMEEHFPGPEKFDMDRHKPPRHEHVGANACVPFGVGTHICGGARWTELQLAVNVLLSARHLELELAPKDYKPRLRPLPGTSPVKRIKFRVTGHRHTIDPTGQDRRPQ